AATIDNLDPRQNLRVEVTLTRENVAPSMSTQTRVLDLYLHARHLNANDGTVELVCRSDEAILIDDVLGGIAVDAGAETYQASLRGIVNYVLAPFGAELEPGDADADFTLTEDGRDPDALKREPGERAWDFLSPLVNAAGLRLFCDEQRRWHLIDPAAYTVSGSLRISEGFNATEAADDIDLSAADRGVPG